MLSCFGAKLKIKKDEDLEEDEEVMKLQDELNRLQIESQEILLDTESFKIQTYFLEDFTNKYKNTLHKLATEQSDKIIYDNLYKVLSKENSDSKQIYESLYSTVRIQETNVKYIHIILKLNELGQNFESMDELNSKNKIEDEIFILENNYIQKENELFNLTCFMKQLKNPKVSTADLDLEFYFGDSQGLNDSNGLARSKTRDKKDEENLMKRILNDELEMTKEIYQQTTKYVLSEKKKEKEKRNKIEELKYELENLKNPKTETTSQMINNYNTMPDSNYTKNTNFNIEKIKTPNLNFATADASTNIKNLENSFQSLTSELKIKKKEINNLTIQLNELKSKNEKLSNQWIGLNNELSEKFSQILKSEMKIEKFQAKESDGIYD